MTCLHDKLLVPPSKKLVHLMVACALIAQMIPGGSVNSEVKTSLPFLMVMSLFNKDSVVESGVDVVSRASRIFILVVSVANVFASTFGQQRI